MWTHKIMHTPLPTHKHVFIKEKMCGKSMCTSYRFQNRCTDGFSKITAVDVIRCSKDGTFVKVKMYLQIVLEITYEYLNLLFPFLYI